MGHHKLLTRLGWVAPLLGTSPERASDDPETGNNGHALLVQPSDQAVGQFAPLGDGSRRGLGPEAFSESRRSASGMLQSERSASAIQVGARRLRSGGQLRLVRCGRDVRELLRLACRGRHSQATVPEDFAADCRAAAEAAARTSMRLPMVMRSTAPDGRTTLRCRGKTDSSDPLPPLGDRMACDPPPTGPGLTESLENRYDLPQIPGSSGEIPA